MRILILDDELARHEGFKKRLQGHTLTHATTAADAIKALNEQEPYDQVYLDHDLGTEPMAHEALPVPQSAFGAVEPQPTAATPVEQNGMQVVDHICQMPESKRPNSVIVHSGNLPRAKEMHLRLRDAGVDAQCQTYLE